MTTNPYEIGVAYNELMKAWDVHVVVGNFASKKEAEETAKRMAKFMGGSQKVVRQ